MFWKATVVTFKVLPSARTWSGFGIGLLQELQKEHTLFAYEIIMWPYDSDTALNTRVEADPCIKMNEKAQKADFHYHYVDFACSENISRQKYISITDDLQVFKGVLLIDLFKV